MAGWRREGENDGKGLFLLPDKVNGVKHGHSIEDGGAGRDQNEIGVLCCLESHITRNSGPVDNGEVCPRFGSGFQHCGEPYRLNGNHSGRFSLSRIAPERGRGLRVQIENGGLLAVLLGGYGKTCGEGCLPHTAFLRQNSQNLHAAPMEQCL